MENLSAAEANTPPEGEITSTIKHHAADRRDEAIDAKMRRVGKLQLQGV
jgi:hypothetical protein